VVSRGKKINISQARKDYSQGPEGKIGLEKKSNKKMSAVVMGAGRRTIWGSTQKSFQKEKRPSWDTGGPTVRKGRGRGKGW